MTDENLPWISPVVHKICLQTVQDPSLIYEYLPDPGLKSFIQASLELLFGKHSPAIVENRVSAAQTRSWQHQDAESAIRNASGRRGRRGNSVAAERVFDPSNGCYCLHTRVDIARRQGACTP